jgi:iron complex transport system permease protein
LTALVALAAGAVAITPGQIAAILAARFGATLPWWEFEPRQESILFAIRLPRVILSAAVGAVLALSGAAVQALFRNPLADPALLGISSGAALAAAAAIVLADALGAASSPTSQLILLPAAAFAGSLLAAFAVYRIGRGAGPAEVATLLLAGIAVNAFAGAAIGLLSFLASESQLRSLTFWTLGSLGSATWTSLLATTPLFALTLAGIPPLAGELNALLLGESEARHLGVDVERLRRRLVVLIALGVAAAVSVTGIIGFVGLVVPHLLRLAAGPDHRLLLPGAALLGAMLLTAADLVARTVIAPAELPIGVVTALLGAPFFLWLLRRDGERGWA